MHRAKRDEMTLGDFHKLGIKDWDDIKITGTIYSEPSRPRVVDMIGTIATVSTATPKDPDDQPAIKVWPKDDQHPGLPTGHNGKLWFWIEGIEEIELIDRPPQDRRIDGGTRGA
jgi:hypothetical protein